MGKAHPFSWSYGTFHDIRLWVAENVCKDPMIRFTRAFPWSTRAVEELMWTEISESRFPHLMKHQDCDGDYIPTDKEEATLERGSSIKLLAELTEIKGVMDKAQDVPEHVRKAFEDLYEAAELSVETKAIMEFS